ncbi:hypothetical protein BDF14DRAFT_1845667 [Spinellus fusiger]|nr:hypothetical protein BDF14DRAFT_1845667 [Spinellus fusiger]
MFKDNTYIGYINDHTIDYLITYVTLLKIGLVLVCLSTKNTAAMNAYILQSVNATVLLATPSYSTIAHDTSTALNNCQVTIVHLYDIDAIINRPTNPKAAEILKETIRKDIDETIVVLHSTGSTGTPKPIRMNSQNILHTKMMINTSEQNFSMAAPDAKPNVFLYCLSLFHISGHTSIISVILSGDSVVFMKPKISCVKEIYAAMKTSKCNVTSFSPLIMEQLLRYTNEINDWSVLQRQRLMIYVGTSLKEEIVNAFRKKQVNTCSMYGSTEAGTLLTGDLSPLSLNKSSLIELAAVKQYCLWETYAPDPRLKHLVIRHDCSSLSISAKRRENGDFNTNDLFMEDITNPGHYLYFSRIEDIVVVNTGYKINPIPIEDTIRQCPIINQCLVFGEGYPCIGILIEVSKEAYLKYSIEEIQYTVYSTIDKANQSAMDFTVIKRSMVKILSENETLPKTDKNTVMRKIGCGRYKSIIDAIYRMNSV